MDGSTVSRLFRFLQQANNKLLRVVAMGVLLGTTTIGVGVTIALTAGEGGKSRWAIVGRSALSFIAATSAELAAATIIYLASVTWIMPELKRIEDEMLANDNVVDPLYERICKKIEELKSPHVTEYKSQFHLTDLDKEIVDATTIDVCVQGWDGLVTHHKEAWVRFLRDKRGQVNLILPKVVKDSKTIEHMMQRLGRPRIMQVNEINNTYAELQKLNPVGEPHGKITRYDYEPMIWYCLIRIDNRIAYLSCYEHIDGGEVESPFLRIRLDRLPLIRAWIDKELVGMKGKSSVGTTISVAEPKP